MPLKLIHGPPNSGRAGLVRRALVADLDHDPILVVPTIDDVYSFQRELCAQGAVLGAEVMTFGGLFRTVATAGGAPPGAELTPAQRLGAVSAAVSAQLPSLRPLGRSARQPGFPQALERLLEELQGAGLEPDDVEAQAGTLEGSAYLGDVAALFAGYARVRDDLGLVDSHGIARAAIEALRRARRVLAAPGLPLRARRPDPEPARPDRGARRARPGDDRAALREGERRRWKREPLPCSRASSGSGSSPSWRPRPTPATPTPRSSSMSSAASAGSSRGAMAPDESIVFLRSAGERGEAEAIAVEIARLLAEGCGAEEIAIVVRDPARRGPLLASVLEARGIPTALEAEIPVATTSVGGSLLALLEAELGAGRAADLLRHLRGPSGVSPSKVDWFERAIRRSRTQTAAAALRLWEQRFEEPPPDLARLREAAGRPDALATAVSELARAMAARIAAAEAIGAESGLRTEAALEARAAGAIANAMAERAELEGLAPRPEALAQALGGIAVRVWSGPVEDRVRIADPYRVRAARFDNVFVASLQDGEFPRGGRPLGPVPLRRPARVARAAAAPRHRGGGALPLPRLPGAAPAAALPLPPRQRRERGGGGPLAAARRGAPAARASRGRRAADPRPRARRRRPQGLRRPLGDRARAGDRRLREPAPRQAPLLDARRGWRRRPRRGFGAPRGGPGRRGRQPRARAL